VKVDIIQSENQKQNKTKQKQKQNHLLHTEIDGISAIMDCRLVSLPIICGIYGKNIATQIIIIIVVMWRN
jgi:hypothetical protein